MGRAYNYFDTAAAAKEYHTPSSKETGSGLFNPQSAKPYRLLLA